MTGLCKTCAHPDRAEIERKIASKELSLTAAAERIGCATSAVHYHYYNHVAPAVRAQLEKDHTTALALNSIDQLVEQYQEVQGVLMWALEQSDYKGKILALKALKEARKFIELNAKITGQYSDAPQVNIMMSPMFLRIQEVMVESLEQHPAARVALSAALDALAEEMEAE
jgi:hypothetical protein